MSLILIVLSLARYCSSSAAHVTSPFADPPDNLAPISTPGPVRTVWDIVWSCLATLLAVAWISAHPDAPWIEEKMWAFMKKRSSCLTCRIFLVCLTVIRPDAMVLHAFFQWRNAVMIKKVMNKARSRSSPQWTMAHAHFLLMGGFIVNYVKGELPHSLDAYEVEKNGIVVQECVLFPATLHSLLQKQLIDFPDTTAKEIIDRSNRSIGTTILKAFAMMQITWFFVHLFARALQHLTITLLESTTAASVVLIVIMYIIWWSKPFDVRQPIVLRTKEVELKLAQMAVGPNEEKWKF